MKVVLGLDLGGTTGFAVLADDQALTSGTWDIEPRRGESPGMRYIHLRRHLIHVLEAWDLSLIIYEQAHYRGGAATEYAVGCATRVQELAAEHGITYSTVHTGTLKKFATGAGNASKEDMVVAASRRWPKHVQRNGNGPMDDNEADALWCAEYGRVELLGLPPTKEKTG